MSRKTQQLLIVAVIAVCAVAVGARESADPALGAASGQTLKKSIWGPTEVGGKSLFPAYRDLGDERAAGGVTIPAPTGSAVVRSFLDAGQIDQAVQAFQAWTPAPGLAGGFETLMTRDAGEAPESS